MSQNEVSKTNRFKERTHVFREISSSASKPTQRFLMRGNHILVVGGLLCEFWEEGRVQAGCEELSMTALDDPSPSVVGSATRILLPVLAKWSLELDRLQASLITHLIQRLKSQTKPSPVESPGKQGLDSDQQMAWTLTVIQTLLPYLVMSVVAVEPVLSTITSDTTVVEPSEVFDLNNGLTNPAIFYEGEYPVSLILGAFDSYVDKEWQEGWPQMDWITSTLLPELLDVLNCTQVNRELVVATFIKMFRYISAGFGRAFVKHKVKPVFAERLQILEKSLTDSRSSIWPSLTIIPVYLVGILAARRDQEFTDELEGLLKRFVCALPVCGAPIHTLEVTIRCLCENTALHETVLAALWEGVVHPRAPVRSSAAILFVSVIGHVSEVLVASRIAPALVTLASDPDMIACVVNSEQELKEGLPLPQALFDNTTLRKARDCTNVWEQQ
uniref:Uncharacterized protein n=1 Tax=Timema poppense TaxID=170557 RepID=A0A7R9D2W8_TIMPO|nr:unnamed protein product [Timema poppensis]